MATKSKILNFEERIETIMTLYQEFKSDLRVNYPNDYERWKAGGFLLDDDIVSMYPTLQETIDNILEDEDEDY